MNTKISQVNTAIPKAAPDVATNVLINIPTPSMTNDKIQASTLGVSGTPGFFINGRFVAGAKPFAEFKRIIDEELAKKG